MDAFLQVLVSLATFVFYASLKTTLVLALVLLLQKIFSRFLSADGRYLLWLAVIVSLITPIGFETRLPNITAAFVQIDAGMYEPLSSLQTASVWLNEPAFDSVTTTTEIEFTSIRILALFWLAGVLLFLFAVARASASFAIRIQQAKPAPQYLQTIMEECMQITACQTKVKLLLDTRLQAPLITGLFRPVLLWPQSLETQLTREQIRHVFIHELMHVQRKDILSNCITSLLQSLYWFNPAIWIAFSCMRHDREMACDAATLKHLTPGERSAYGYTLIHLGDTLPSQTVSGLGLGIVDSHSHLRKRILMLVQASFSRKTQSVFAILLFLPLVALAFSQATTDAPQQIRPETLSTATIPAAEPAQIPDVSGINIEPDSTPLVNEKDSSEAPIPTPLLAEETIIANDSPPASPPLTQPEKTVAYTEAAPAISEHLTVAAAPANTDAAQSFVPSTTAANQPQYPPLVLAKDEKICRLLSAASQKVAQQVCDTGANWIEFDLKLAASTVKPATEASALTDTKVCRMERQANSKLIKKVCYSPEMLAVLERDAELARLMHQNNQFENTATGAGTYSIVPDNTGGPTPPAVPITPSMPYAPAASVQ